jgi:hypothetical protein
VSTDAAVVDGESRWWRHALGTTLPGGAFDHWTVMAEPQPALETHLAAWLGRHMRGYTGMMNFETIAGTIIEVHLRFADQWPDLYGTGWIESVVELYTHGRWRFEDAGRRTGHSVVLFGAHGTRYHVDRHEVAALRRRPGVSSIQITFHEERPPEAHAMPPGGFRLAIVNCWDLEVGREVRARLAGMFAAAATPFLQAAGSSPG